MSGHNKYKLSLSDIETIRHLLKQGEKIAEISRMFSVDTSTVQYYKKKFKNKSYVPQMQRWGSLARVREFEKPRNRFLEGEQMNAGKSYMGYIQEAITRGESSYIRYEI